MTSIKSRDIQAGDTIKVTEVNKGVRTERTGIVGRVDSMFGSLTSTEGGTLWNGAWAGKFSFDLIDRPVPPLPDRDGALIVAKGLKFNESLNVPLVNRGGLWETLGGGFRYRASEITGWTDAKVVEA